MRGRKSEELAEFDRLVSKFSYKQKVALLWEGFDFLADILVFPQFEQSPDFEEAGNLLRTLSDSEYEKTLQKYEESMAEVPRRKAVEVILSDDFKFPEKVLPAAWLTRYEKFKSKDLTSIFSSFEVNSSNLSSALDSLVKQKLLLEHKSGNSDPEYSLSRNGFEKLKRTMKIDPP